MIEKKLSELDFDKLCDRKFHTSPAAWEDQVFYFMMADRFSDGKEKGYRDNSGKVVTSGKSQIYKDSDSGNAVKTELSAKAWREAGGKWVGGNLKGLMSKIGYLKRMGVSTIWVSPIFKQVSFQDTYHGYGIQNFLDIDKHFGSRKDLKNLVDTAHKHGIYVILDIILNHSGNIFSYEADRFLSYDKNSATYYMDPRWDGNRYKVKGYNDKDGNPAIPYGKVDLSKHPEAWPDGAVWPAEFQDEDTFTREGRIDNWDYEKEFLKADFFDLKDINLGEWSGAGYEPSKALKNLAEVYKFWIAFADLDGFRVDTVKHMDPIATRYFISMIHEFAQSIGKDNFYLIGEVTGGREAASTIMETTGLNAALGINDIPVKIESMIKGDCNPQDYFDLFRNSMLVKKDSHVWFRNKVVTLFNDHDQVSKGEDKARFASGNDDALLLCALAVNLFTLGIPCVYYGTEQAFDGEGGNDRFIREAMFGGEFGPFRSKKKHCFNEKHLIYKELSKMIKVRKEKMVLRRGRQYLRPISGDGIHFGVPAMVGSKICSIIPWSRIFNQEEMVLAINNDINHDISTWVTIDNTLHQSGEKFKCVYSTNKIQIKEELKIDDRNGKAVLMTVPAGGFVIFEKVD